MTVFKIIGGFVLYGATATLLAGILALTGQLPRLAPGVSVSIFCLRLAAVVIPLGIVGAGLFYLRKWAALLFSGLTLYLAFWSAWLAIHAVDSAPGNADWLGFVYAVLLTIPSVLTVKYWRVLTWHRRTTA